MLFPLLFIWEIAVPVQNFATVRFPLLLEVENGPPTAHGVQWKMLSHLCPIHNGKAGMSALHGISAIAH